MHDRNPDDWLWLQFHPIHEMCHFNWRPIASLFPTTQLAIMIPLRVAAWDTVPSHMLDQPPVIVYHIYIYTVLLQFIKITLVWQNSEAILTLFFTYHFLLSGMDICKCHVCSTVTKYLKDSIVSVLIHMSTHNYSG